MEIIKYFKIYFVFSGILMLASIISVIVFGLNLGIEFTGGTILEIEYEAERPSNSLIRKELADLDLGEFFLQPTAERGLIIKMKDIDETTHQQVIERLQKGNNLHELRFETIGPTIGKELKNKTMIIAILSLLSIVLYIGFSFRKITMPVKSWQYGAAALLSLFHDVLIPVGVFAVLGKFYGVQITIPVIVALLTVLGYSINNTVVVFDRIRENLLKRLGIDYQDTVNRSIEQSLARCINTSLTTLFVLASIYFFGGETLKFFALALILGIIAGAYTSIFLAGPILVAWQRHKKLS